MHSSGSIDPTIPSSYSLRASPPRNSPHALLPKRFERHRRPPLTFEELLTTSSQMRSLREKCSPMLAQSFRRSHGLPWLVDVIAFVSSNVQHDLPFIKRA